MILIVVVCKFYFAFIHGFLVKQVSLSFLLLSIVVINDFLVR